MESTKKYNILVGQSGGPTAVINASLYGVIAEGMRHNEQIEIVYGMINGIEGFLDGKCMELSRELSLGEIELLKYTPAAYLGSCRYKLPEDENDAVYTRLFQMLEEKNIGAVLYIGGNDSMDTVSKLSRLAEKRNSPIRFLGVPKTVDNDLMYTDHTPGYASATKYVATTVREICLDSSVYHQRSVTIVELMGRHAGWITAASVLARKYGEDNPRLIYLPEWAFDMEQFAADVEEAFLHTNNLIVCVSEGIKDKDGVFICEYGDGTIGTDTFGHKMLTGCGKVLENFVKERFGVKVRSVEVNVSQRCSSVIASQTDIDEAAMSGAFAVRAAMEGETGKMAAFKRLSDTPYQITCELVDVDAICNLEKTFPMEWITENGTNIGEEFLNYVRPLIQGEPLRRYQDGLPVYVYRKR